MKTVHIIISGKVQGVFFRATAKEVAEKYNIKGWVKNTNEGKVETLVTGEEQDINKFIEWCNKGPEKAHVEDVSVKEAELKRFDSFKVIR